MASREDGEISDESPKSVNVEENEDDFLQIDRNSSGIVAKDDEEKGDEDAKKEDGEMSRWQKNIRKRLLDAPAEKAEEEPQNKRRRMSCFNCQGDHNIGNCPEPKDFARIRKNKMEFQANSQQQNNGGRISKIVESESKFKPGRLSQKLRDALEIGPDDIPEWIYRMRRMGFHRGYPPGHLQKALKHEVQFIKIFSDEASEKSEKAEKTGELEARPAPTLEKNKVHFYMGFNKTYGALRDREDGLFEVPPFDVFCEMLQVEITRNHDESEQVRLIDETMKRREIQKIRENEPEIEKLEEDIVVDRSKTDSDEGDKKDQEEEGGDGDKSINRGDGPLGESISQLIGTPVFSSRSRPESIPSLEAFAAGIVPFEAKEEEKPRGIFQKIMSTLRRK